MESRNSSVKECLRYMVFVSEIAFKAALQGNDSYSAQLGFLLQQSFLCVRPPREALLSFRTVIVVFYLSVSCGGGGNRLFIKQPHLPDPQLERAQKS